MVEVDVNEMKEKRYQVINEWTNRVPDGEGDSAKSHCCHCHLSSLLSEFRNAKPFIPWELV